MAETYTSPLQVIAADEKVDPKELQAKMLAVFEKLEDAQTAMNTIANEEERHAISEMAGGIDLDKLPPSGVADLLYVYRMEQERVRATEELARTRNRVSKSEYQARWYSLHETLDPKDPNYAQKKDQRIRLSDEFKQHFILTMPITIYEDGNPDNVLCIIPPTIMPINTVQGLEPSVLFDVFVANSSETGRPDYRIQAGNAIAMHLHQSQALTPEMVKKLKLTTFAANLKVLQVFNPDHPLLKLVDNLANDIKKEHAAETVVGKNTATIPDGATVVDDSNAPDFF